MERIFIFNGSTEELIAVAGYEGAMPVLTAPSNEQLNKDFTLQVSVPADHENAVHIKEGNLIGYLDLDGDLQAFTIYKTEEIHGGATLEKVAYAEHLFYELLDDVVEDQRAYGVTASVAMDKALANSRWAKGTVADLGLGDTNFYYNNGLNNVREIVNEYGGELKFRLTYNAGKITGRFVDLLARRGADTGKRLEYSKDIENIKRTVDATDIKTAMYGRGKSSETEAGGYTRRADFGGVIWVKTNGNPADKPYGQEYVADPTALTLYGRANGTRHRYGVVEFDIEDPALLLQATWDFLQTVNKPRLTYEVTAIDLERISGLSHEKVRLGDTVFIIDRDLNLTVEARVIEINRDIIDPTNSTFKLGNFIPLFVNIAVELEKVKNKLSEKEGIWDGGSTPVTDGDIAIEAPAVPTNFTASGLFENISLKWDFTASIKVAGYEVYGSMVNNFTPDTSNLLWRGKAGGMVHRATPNQTWYFRVRAFNPNGDFSAFSGQISGATAKINGTYIADVTITNAQIKDVSADKMNVGTLNGTNVNITNLNADNIVGGKVKAQFVEIGATTTFTTTDYDPSKKLGTVFQGTPPTNKNVIWVDNSDPTNPKWKVWEAVSQQWVLGPNGPQGIQGPPGDDGASLYTWIKYADTATGTGMSDSPTGKKYMGIAYNKVSPTESATAGDYTWSLIEGPQGIEGPPGDDGVTTYTWVKYADDANGAGLSDSPTGKRYLGLAYNKTTATESTTATDYSWSPLYDNVQVGGRNVMTDSYLKRMIAYTNSTLTRTAGDETGAGAETNILKVTANTITTTYFGVIHHSSDFGIPFKAGEPYTLSFKARGNVTNFNYTYFRRATAEGGNTSLGTINVTLDPVAWTTVTVTKTSAWDTSTGHFQIASRDMGTVAGEKWFEIMEVKLEQGNIATDFTVSPEDEAQDIDDKLGEITLAYTTAIGNTEDSIYTNVGEMISDSEGEMIKYTDSKITQTASNINLKFTTVEGTQSDHAEQLAEIYTYFDFSATGLNIGKSDSPLQINISNSQMDFIDNGNIVAYVNGQKMYINTAEILQSIIVGNHKIEKYDSNITLVKWVGG